MKWKSIKRKLLVCAGTIVIILGVIIHRNFNKVEIVTQPTKIVDNLDKKNKQTYIEYIKTLQVGMKAVSKIIVSESQIKVTEKFGYSKTNTITLNQSYNCAFGFDTKNLIIKYDEVSDKINITLNSKDIKLQYCDPISDVEIINKNESIGNKLSDIVSSDDTELMRDATNSLNKAANQQSNQLINKIELHEMASKCITNNVKKILGNDIKINVSILNNTGEV